MKKIFAVLTTLVLIAFNGCKKYAGDPITKSFSIEDHYFELEVEDAFHVVVSDTASQIFITAGDKVMPYVKVEVRDNKLSIYLKGINNNRGSDMKVILPYNPYLEKVHLSGASEFHTDSVLKAETVVVMLSGASDFYGDIEAENIEIDLSGSSDMHSNVSGNELDLDLSGASDAFLKGSVSMLKMDLSGASSIIKGFDGNRYALACHWCEGSLSGSSDAYLHCDIKLKVSLSGASELHYTGDASTAGSTTTGGSELIHDVF